MIAIIDYDMGNLGSIENILRRIGTRAIITSSVEEIAEASKIILPGVGFFAIGMMNLQRHNLIPVLNKKALEDRVPVLGVCLGMQLLTNHSEEGDANGLGWIDAETKRFNLKNHSLRLKIPHVGWNSVNIIKNSPLFDNVPDSAEFYFVHSYHVCCKSSNDIVATTKYGDDFVSVIQSGNIFGTQFHPEKSRKAGIELLKNFARMA